MGSKHAVAVRRDERVAGQAAGLSVPAVWPSWTTQLFAVFFFVSFFFLTAGAWGSWQAALCCGEKFHVKHVLKRVLGKKWETCNSCEVCMLCSLLALWAAHVKTSAAIHDSQKDLNCLDSISPHQIAFLQGAEWSIIPCLFPFQMQPWHSVKDALELYTRKAAREGNWLIETKSGRQRHTWPVVTAVFTSSELQ